jgi:hypothetical protein
MKDQLGFDVTDADTIADSDTVGAFLRSADGTLLTHTTNGAKESLDVNIANTGAIAVSATDLDIRDLDSATDSVAAVQSGTWEVALDAATLAALETITVTATDLDIRDLDAAQDSVQANLFDGTGNAISSTGGAIDVNIASAAVDTATAATAIATAANALTAANTAENVVASPLSNRKYLYIYNNGNRKAFIGQSGVSAASGFPLSPGATMELRAGPAVDIEWVSANTSQEIRTLELS